MAREYAQIKVAIWSDDDWRNLTPPAQHLYFTLLTSPSLSHCGVVDWRPNRIAAFGFGWGVEDVQAAATELIERLYIVVDEDTEEALIRSFLRNDGLMKQPKMAVAMASAYGAIASSALRGVVVHELNRLRQDQPDLNGWGSTKAQDVLARPSVDPSTYPLGKGWVKGTTEGSVWGNRTPQGKGCPTPAPTPAPTPSNLSPSPSGSRRSPEHPIPDDWQPSPKHAKQADDNGLNLNGEAFKFRNHAHANDRRQRNWDAAFTTWLARAVDYAPKRNGGPRDEPLPSYWTNDVTGLGTRRD
jgi:hypothetical protein